MDPSDARLPAAAVHLRPVLGPRAKSATPQSIDTFNAICATLSGGRQATTAQIASQVGLGSGTTAVRLARMESDGLVVRCGRQHRGGVVWRATSSLQAAPDDWRKSWEGRSPRALALQRQIIEVMAAYGGRATGADVGRALGRGRAHVCVAMRALADRGRIEKLGHRRGWQLVV